MDKTTLQEKRDEARAEFEALRLQQSQVDTSLVKTQGKIELLTELIKDLEGAEGGEPAGTNA